MDEDMKKPILIGVIVVCLVSAGMITLKFRSGRRGGIPRSFAKEMTWVKCRNPECEAEYQITKMQYYKYVEEHADPRSISIPALPCKKCGEPSVFAAVKCGQCGLVFEKGWKPDDFEDRCPKPECGYSTIEVNRKEAAERRGSQQRTPVQK